MRWNATAAALAALCLLSSNQSGAAGVKHSVDNLDARVTTMETAVEAALRELQELLELIEQATPGRLCAATCVGENMAQLSFTTADGDCDSQVNYSCQPYRCFEPLGTCLTQCVSDAECAASHRCKSGQCLLRPAYCSDDPNNLTPGPGRYVVTSDRRVINCLPFVCGEFGCLERCTSKLDCYDGYVCGAEGDCLPPISP